MIERYGRVYATVDLDAIRYNMDSMRAGTAPGTGFFAVIKTDGYGHGAVPIAKELEGLFYVCGFAVATAEEAVILRRAGIKKPILILGYTFPYCYEEMLREDIRLTVFRYDTVEQLAVCAAGLKEEAGGGTDKKKDLRAKVHIKVDTGMSRIGIRPDASGIDFIKKALSVPEIEVEGLFTHFSKADERDKAYARRQLDTFKSFIEQAQQETGYQFPVCHISNSAGIVELKEANMDAVRAGITLYGLWPSEEVDRNLIDLKPAMELKSHIVYIKEVEKGTPVSYGGTFITKKNTRIATIPVGYGDGYPRGLSNKGYILIRGKRAPVVGRVCMDQFMADVTGIPEAKEGDEVTLIGKDGGECITMEQLGSLSGRFNYELACLIGKRVPRVFLKAGKIAGTKDYFHDFE